jgi:diphosphomevalonate decarboxylase
MIHKATATAPSNIAFIKYWGKKNEILRLPENGSISMNLSGLQTITTVEFDEKLKNDEIIYNGFKEDNGTNRAILQIDLIRKIAKIDTKVKVVTTLNFPPSTGLSSSASGFAALTLATSYALGLNLSEKELSILARQGSGSACRSIPDGFVEWIDGNSSESSYSISLYPPDYWNLKDIVVVVTSDKKEIPTTQGMKGIKKSPFYQTRMLNIKQKIRLCKESLKNRDFEKLGQLSESEALEMHAVMITQQPPLIYWTSGTLQLMKYVQKWRREGILCYFTINTGQNIHLLCDPESVEKVKSKLSGIEGIKNIIINAPAVGARIINSHLF